MPRRSQVYEVEATRKRVMVLVSQGIPSSAICERLGISKNRLYQICYDLKRRGNGAVPSNAELD